MSRPLTCLPVLLAMVLGVSPLVVSCDKGDKDKHQRDWRPVMDEIDIGLVRSVLEARGWSETGEPYEATITAKDVRSMGGQAAGDTSMTSYQFAKDKLSASVVFTKYPGDVEPATGDRGISLEQALLAAGPGSVGISVTDENFDFEKEASVGLLDEIIAAAERQIE